jgi:RNA polymerase sigma-70 factor (ECF subfamily)
MMTDVLDAHDTTVEKLLTKEQLYRLKQIHLQREGPTALLSRYATRELSLSAAQEDKLSDALKPLLKPKLMDIVPQGLAVSDSPERGKIIQRLAARHDTMMEEAMKCLTAEQKAKWKEMIGAEVATAILVVASPESFLWRAQMDTKK